MSRGVCLVVASLMLAGCVTRDTATAPCGGLKRSCFLHGTTVRRRRNRRVRRPGHAGGQSDSYPSRNGCHVRQRWHAVGREADADAAAVRARAREGARPGASRVEDAAPFTAVLDGEWQRLAESGEPGLMKVAGRHPRGHDDRGVHEDRHGVDRDRSPSALPPALHQARLPADARAAHVPAVEWLLDVHRLRRRRRVHAAVGRSGLRHPATR